MPYGLPWSEEFVHDMEDKEFRDEFVADQVRLRIATLIRALREQPDRDWSQAELGREMGKPQSVVSRLEDPDYGKPSIQTLLEVGAAYKLPLWIDFPEWEDWFWRIGNVPNSKTHRRSFDAKWLSRQAKAAKGYVTEDAFSGLITPLAAMVPAVAGPIAAWAPSMAPKFPTQSFISSTRNEDGGVQPSAANRRTDVGAIPGVPHHIY
jgi:transcriptional regulator with XRE-family HTH domain